MDVYTERPIHPVLADGAVCGWVNPPARQWSVILPDACMDLMWDGTSLIVAGPDTGPVQAEPGSGFVGIRFRPGAAITFLGTSAEELRDRRVSLDQFWGREADELAERLAETPGVALRLLEQSLLAHRRAATSDPLLAQVVHELAQSEGHAGEIRALARRLGVDSRTLRRRCVQGFGYGPKTLDRILRFRRALRLGRAGHTIAAAAFAAGYADQAHLGRECCRLAGMTPGVLFADPNAIVSSID